MVMQVFRAYPPAISIVGNTSSLAEIVVENLAESSRKPRLLGVRKLVG